MNNEVLPGRKFREKANGKIWTALQPAMTWNDRTDWLVEEKNGSMAAYNLANAEYYEPIDQANPPAPRLAKPGETWRLHDGEVVANLKQDGAILRCDRNKTWTGDWPAAHGDLVSESPPADPHAGVDWSRYLPKEPLPPVVDQEFRIGDVWAERCPEPSLGSVFRVTGFDGDWIRRDSLTHCGGGIFHTDSKVAKHSHLIARDGKLVAQGPATVPDDMFKIGGPPDEHGWIKNLYGDVIGRTNVSSPSLSSNLRLTPAQMKAFENTVERELKIGRYAEPPKPAPSAHDFTNPYLVRTVGREKERLCVTCGLGATASRCEPKPEWREKHEKQITVDTGLRDIKRMIQQILPKPPKPPYHNDVAGIGAVLGGYLNVAPERGR